MTEEELTTMEERVAKHIGYTERDGYWYDPNGYYYSGDAPKFDRDSESFNDLLDYCVSHYKINSKRDTETGLYTVVLSSVDQLGVQSQDMSFAMALCNALDGFVCFDLVEQAIHDHIEGELHGNTATERG